MSSTSANMRAADWGNRAERAIRAMRNGESE
jgi:hypothetical protein